MKTEKKPKATPEQLREQRLWKNADKHCRALLEHCSNTVRATSLSFSLERGVTVSMLMSLSFNVKVPKKAANPWSITTQTRGKGKKATKYVASWSK